MKKLTRAERAYLFIKDNPYCTTVEIADGLGIRVTSELLYMCQQGYLQREESRTALNAKIYRYTVTDKHFNGRIKAYGATLPTKYMIEHQPTDPLEAMQSLLATRRANIAKFGALPILDFQVA